MEGTHLLCRDCGHICETADAPNTDSGFYDPCCPDCHHNWMVDPVTEIERLEDTIKVMREKIREVARENYRA